jgi:hypothetical protein
MKRSLVTAILAALALIALAVPALAKEGAVTKFDSLPTQWIANQSYTLGYTIRMDGVEPYKADRTEIVATSVDGKTELTFLGVADGAPGHYTAKVLFPAAGTYQWKVTQGTFFAPFDLGSITVAPATAGAAAPSVPIAPVGDALPYLAATAVVIATLLLARTQRRRLMRTA